jgi:hypothetical protein
MWIESTPDRRGFFSQFGAVLCSAALTELLGRDLYGADDTPGRAAFDLKPRSPNLPPRARAVIHLFMNGGPSQMDLFDPKPELEKRHGEDYFNKIAGEVEFPEAAGALMKSPFRFAQHGDSGMWVSDAMPHFAKQVDQVSLVRSLYSTNLTHEPALYKIQSGSEFTGRPTLGAWVSYGLGTVNRNLPAYVVLDDRWGCPSTASTTGLPATSRPFTREPASAPPVRRFSISNPASTNRTPSRGLNGT